MSLAVGFWCAVAALAHERGRRRIRRERAPGRVVGTGQVALFWLGLVVVVVSLSAPIDTVAHDLFSVHMVQHLLLALVAPLLLCVAQPLRVMAWALPVDTRRVALRAGARGLRRVGVRRTAAATALGAVALHVLVLALWHVPEVYDAAESSTLLHGLEHLSLFATGAGVWWVVLGVGWQHRSGLAIVYLFLAGLPMGALAALLTLAPSSLYDAHRGATEAWDLTPLEDQQLAGAIMWVPGGAVYLVSAIVLFVRWLDEGPRPGERRIAWEG